MIKVKFLTRSASASGIIQIGEVVEVPDNEAKLLIKGGYAISLEEKTEEVVEAVEKPKKTKKEK